MSDLARQLIAENKKTRSTYLDLGNCGLTHLPPEIGECVWVETLILSNKWLEYNLEEEEWETKESQNKGEPNSIASIADLEKLVYLRKLVVSKHYTDSGKNWAISDLSPLSGLLNLQQLYCSYTPVSDLSPLSGLLNLQAISCSYTFVSDLMPLSGLLNLQQLHCSYTPISDLSPLSGLLNLQQLYCSSTQVSDLSPISGLLNLQQLDCFSTQVSDLSPISGLLNLQQLDCGNTKVSGLSTLSGLFNLQRLDCPHTLVRDLSPLSELFNLELFECSHTGVSDLSPLSKLFENQYFEFFFDDCPLTTPPIEIVEKGSKAILQYFEELARAKTEGGTIRLAEAKCLIIGEGGSGKTSLARKLLNRDNPLPEEAETTKGIAVHPLDLKLPDGTNFRLNIWDFGGQEIYHATHQFFLTKRSLYLLLDDTRKDEKTVHDPTFNYWLQVAGLYGGDSPLCIVQNEKGDRSKELDLKSMQARFGFVKSAEAVNLLDCRGLDQVWAAIFYWLKRLPHIGEEQPKAWLDIRLELERMAKEDGCEHISLETYFGVCKRFGIPERERALFLSGYLHDFGAFLHFQDHPLLRKTLVLNNQWATDAVYKVLDFEQVKKAFGRFSHKDLAHIWADDRYAGQHDELLALMEKFELCYKLPDEKTDTWLAPQLLTVKQPDPLVWDETDNLQLRYDYEFMPKGLLSQHMVRMQRYVKQPELAWKNGIFFERSGSHALVTGAWDSRKISIRAHGPNAKELLTLLSEDFDKMHDRLEGLRVKKMIPCNCSVCGKAAEPHFYEFEDLDNRKRGGKPTVECKVSWENVPVLGLLDGVFATASLQPRQLLEAGQIEDALRQLPPSDEASLLLGQFTDAEREFQYGRISHQEFESVKNRVSAAAMKLVAG